MPATKIPSSIIVGPYTATPVAATSLDLTFAAADPTNGNYFSPDLPNGDILIVWNQDSSSHHFTLTSQQDSPFLRTGDITSYVVGAGVVSFYNLQAGVSDTSTDSIEGWQTAGQVLFSADSAEIFFAVVAR
jgi:hypothetical protein